MEFCEKCGGVIIVEGDKVVCGSCGHRLKKKVKIEVSQKLGEKKEISVIKEGEESAYPIVEIKCPKCNEKKAYFWTTQTRASDESETKFYRCVKCKHTWRVYR